MITRRQDACIEISSTMAVADLARTVVDTAERGFGRWGIEYLGPDGTRLWFGVHRLGLGRKRETVMRFIVTVDADFDGAQARSQIEQFVCNPASGTFVPIGPRQLRGYPTYLAYLRAIRTAVLDADPGAHVTMVPEVRT
ncbi:hypothetical protein CH274_10195 [Rhodococcus sp. 06-418-5]|jgi:hypothetical protein|uniref:hypothetical protein n=1 Tax=Nocardiaceae TaxID=85025 RepID=UPI00050CFF24|nr:MULTISPECIES: hypothetical protein [Rhodococcus]OZC67798.1 hypothetical protein CH276_05130 [Rhodococcus sp. 06-470-2]OZC81212.1 hypothetical protein CH274_10195 [Rhodococcus sp. 06-418-5]OZD85690.1 hypothetical protein CH273_02795 [Rhodococcus sp. 05-339-2]OZE62315.1 hypothetical protein CH265_12755 [Rhodococcus sp. 05-2221-1B]OZE62894.1 hypothetical protein CH265_16195 [Rhodococcus sp. 05-2221-1B]